MPKYRYSQEDYYSVKSSSSRRAIEGFGSNGRGGEVKDPAAERLRDEMHGWSKGGRLKIGKGEFYSPSATSERQR